MLSFKWDRVILLSLPEDLIDVDIDENDTAVADDKNTDSSTNMYNFRQDKCHER